MKNISVKRGERFAIALPEDHAAGQTWNIQAVWDAGMLEYLKSFYNGKEDGTTDFIFDAKQPGNTEVLFKLIEYSDLKDSLRIAVKVE